MSVVPTDPERHPLFTQVRIAPRAELEAFVRSWKYHHPLSPEQLEYAGQIATVRATSVYHGGEVLYELAGIPGYWHQQLLQPVTVAPPSVDF